MEGREDMEEMTESSWSKFVKQAFEKCFVCGYPKFCEFYHNENIYRVCADCLKKPNVKEFFEK